MKRLLVLALCLLRQLVPIALEVCLPLGERSRLLVMPRLRGQAYLRRVNDKLLNTARVLHCFNSTVPSSSSARHWRARVRVWAQLWIAR